MAACTAWVCAVARTFSAMSSVSARISDTLFGRREGQIETVHALLGELPTACPVGGSAVIEPVAGTSVSASPPCRADSSSPVDFAIASPSPMTSQLGIRVSSSE